MQRWVFSREFKVEAVKLVRFSVDQQNTQGAS